jgi:hypothetical protein
MGEEKDLAMSLSPIEIHSGDGDTISSDPEAHAHVGSGDCKELFKKSMTKKTNIYSTSSRPLNTPWTFWVDR